MRQQCFSYFNNFKDNLNMKEPTSFAILQGIFALMFSKYSSDVLAKFVFLNSVFLTLTVSIICCQTFAFMYISCTVLFLIKFAFIR